MKKITFTFLALLFSSAFCLAQDSKDVKHTDKGNAYFGFKVGYTNSTLTKAVDTSEKSGVHFGGVAEFFVANKVAIHAELLYTNMGAKLDKGYPPNYLGGKVTLNYIVLPVMVKYYIVEGLNVKVGGQFGLAVKTEGTLNGGKANSSGDIGSIVNKTDFGFTTGLGYDFANNVFVDARAYFGAVDVLKNVGSNKNFALNIGVGYKF